MTAAIVSTNRISTVRRTNTNWNSRAIVSRAMSVLFVRTVLVGICGNSSLRRARIRNGHFEIGVREELAMDERTFWLFVAANRGAGQRYGQALFNALYQLEPEFADLIRGTNADPFYSVETDDGTVRNFILSVFGREW